MEPALANYFVSYDLNGARPTHAEMDEHLKKLGKCVHRVLETVWFVPTSTTKEGVYNYANRILSDNDRLLVIDAQDGIWRNLLVSNETMQGCWSRT
jgi:hypothetical protein